MFLEIGEVLQLKNLNLSSSDDFPELNCVYFCVHNIDILYIGSTSNLRKRWKQHHITINFLSYSNVKVYWYEINEERLALENKLIKHWNPLFNNKKRKNNPRVEYCEMLSHPDFSGEASRVLLAIIPFLDFNNYLILTLSDVSKILNMNPSSVTRGLKKLEKIGVVERGERVGTFYKFKLNSKYAWKGNLSPLKMFLQHNKEDHIKI